MVEVRDSSQRGMKGKDMGCFESGSMLTLQWLKQHQGGLPKLLISYEIGLNMILSICLLNMHFRGKLRTNRIKTVYFTTDLLLNLNFIIKNKLNNRFNVKY